MYVLIACECSQKVCAAFRKKGHLAFSCDLQESYGGHPEWHIQSDCRMAIRNKWMYTEDGKRHYIPKWDIIIRHPPCTYFSRAGASRLYQNEKLNRERYKKGLKYKKLFMWLYEERPKFCDRICIENPVPMKIWELPKETQSIQPYQFGEPYTKQTYLWLIKLRPLMGTYECIDRTEWTTPQKGSNKNKARKRSETFQGIAERMAQQWG